ncbi:MAG: FAD-dependent oxidoreductase [Candidatus Liptonbacteria bacterium]
MYDLIIVGGGPGGVAAGIYGARKKIKSLLITETFGGQSIVSADIQNWVGTKNISGLDLAKTLEEHLRAQEGIDIKDGQLATEVSEIPGGLKIKTSAGEEFETRYLLWAAGSRRRKLGVPGEKEFDGKGVAYCATCDAPLFGGKNVVVVGGGNSGLESVLDLLAYADKIYLLEHGNALRGDLVTQEKMKNNPKVEIILNAQTLEIIGDKFVTGLKYKDRISGTDRDLAVQGVFVEIGAIPNSEPVKNLVQLDKFNQVIADPRTQKTSHTRIWAIGDVSDVLYKQNNISVGDGVKALLNIYEQLHKN